MWWKRNKWKLIAPVLVLAVLAAAFWYGGGASGLRGWGVAKAETVPTPELAAAPASAPERTPELQPVQTPEVKTEEPAETAAPEPENAPEEPDEVSSSDIDSGDGNNSEPRGTVIDPDTGTDRYNTDPVPEGMPLPVEPQDAVISDTAYTCTISISCASILDHIDWLDPEKTELIPEDGWILEPAEVTFYEGESVFNVLQRVCKLNGIHLEFEDTPIYNSAYIEGIHNIYQFDCGELSGWMYKVNEWFPNYGCSRCQLKDGDVVCWVYTCELGEDVGGRNATGG